MARSDKKLFQLGADGCENVERAEQLFRYLQKHSLSEGVRWVRDQFGVRTSLRAMGEFRRDWPLEQIVLRLNDRIAASRRIVADGGADVQSLTPTNLKLLEQQITELLATGADEKRIGSFIKMYSTLMRASDIPAQTQLAIDRFQFDAAKAALKHAKELRRIAGDRDLSDDARVDAARKRLFGVAV